MTSRPILALASAAVVVVGATLAGCSSSTDTASPAVPTEAPQAVASASPAAFMAQAADSTTAAGSARVTSTTAVGGSAEMGTEGQDTTIRADGVVDFAGNEAALRVSASLFGGGSDMQVVLSDGKSYVQVPMFGEKWIAIPMGELGLNLSDPAKGLDMLKQAADLKEVGKESIDGVEATKYTGTLDLQEALGQAGLPADAEADLSGKIDKVSGDAQVTVWVDDEGRIIRFDQTATIDMGTGKAVKTTSSTTLSDFGVATDITPPPADQVVDADELSQMGGLGGTGG